MAISQKLQARLAQKLILTPSLQQAIKLLPMTTLELAELLNQEMVENPMLEEVPSEEPVQEAAPAAEAEKKPEKDEAWDDADYEYFFGEYLDEGYRPVGFWERLTGRGKPGKPDKSGKSSKKPKPDK